MAKAITDATFEAETKEGLVLPLSYASPYLRKIIGRTFGR